MVTCAICYNEIVPNERLANVELVCTHTFHRICIAEWYKRNNKCPMCRNIMKEICNLLSDGDTDDDVIDLTE